eukprot:1150169-Prorocentrum_lima.AAC.1
MLSATQNEGRAYNSQRREGQQEGMGQDSNHVAPSASVRRSQPTSYYPPRSLSLGATTMGPPKH